MFRGVAVFGFYFFMLGWNVWGWRKYRIDASKVVNYRRNLRPASTFLARGSFFIFGFILTFSWYIFSRARVDYISQESDDNIPVDYLGAMGWCFIIG